MAIRFGMDYCCFFNDFSLKKRLNKRAVQVLIQSKREKSILLLGSNCNSKQT